ncbi:hypothetical protein [Streptomyces sp. NPDC001652]|uniref:hypothetical protein n=1 Tax=Streptomyces sp. NPDC001652 TaxID=3154393 RepID=UPI00332320A1
MIEAIVGIVGAVIGGAVGLTAALIARRSATHQSQTGYRAALEQADSTYRAALDQARAQALAGHRQWRREAQRDAYAAFIIATGNLHRMAEPDSRPPDGVVDDIVSALIDTESAFAVVQLEGPQNLVDLAEAVVAHCRRITHAITRDAPAHRARILLDAALASDDANSMARARAASNALYAFGVAVARRAYGDAAPSYTDSDQAPAAAMSARACLVERSVAAQRALQAVDGMTPTQIRALLEVTERDERGAGSELLTDHQQLARTTRAFVDAARIFLDSVTEDGPGLSAG